MYEALLFPTDGSDGASVALDHVLDIAAAHGATVHVINVVDTTQDGVGAARGDVGDALSRRGEGIVEEAAGRAERRGVDVVTDVLEGQPYSTIVEYAGTHGIDLVVMPTHGRRGLGRLLLGSTTERVVRRSDVPVLTIRPREDALLEYPYADVLVPTDGSEQADHALTTGIDVVTATDARLHLLSVISMAALGVDVRSDLQLDILEENAEGILDAASERAERAGLDPTTTVAYGSSIHSTIRSHVEDNDVDLVVVGTHGRTGFDRYVLGSVTEKLVRTSPVPVLTVRGPPDGSA
jgi:nucleotide-binding universal stress UspA family protein